MADTIGRLSVLVVDDDRDVADTTAELLRLDSQDVRVCYCGKDAVRETQNRVPQIAFLDISMPEMDGFALAAVLRQRALPSPVVLIAVTGDSSDECRSSSQESGFDLFLVKPVAPSRFNSVLEMCLRLLKQKQMAS